MIFSILILSCLLLVHLQINKKTRNMVTVKCNFNLISDMNNGNYIKLEYKLE